MGDAGTAGPAGGTETTATEGRASGQPSHLAELGAVPGVAAEPERPAETGLVRVVSIISNAGMVLSATAIILIMLLTVASSLSRTFGAGAIRGADELAQYLVVGAIYLGLAFTLKEGAFVRVDVLRDRLGRRGLIALDGLTHLISVVYASVLTWYFWQLVLDSYAANNRSIGVLQLPLYIPQALMALGASLVLIQLLVRTVLSVRGEERP